MNTRRDLVDLARLVAHRSTCRVQVGAVLSDCRGVFAWGWNNAGPDGLGECAERMALRRANRARLAGARLTIVALRRSREITSQPCRCCHRAILAAGVPHVSYQDVGGTRVTWSVEAAA
jgi:deoxycytidylate deaminase